MLIIGYQAYVEPPRHIGLKKIFIVETNLN